MIITSRRNSRVVEARKLEQKKHRQEQNAFLVEGLQILHMALDTAHYPQRVFYCEDLFSGPEAPALMERFRATDADLVHVSDYVMDSLSDRSMSQGLVAVFELFETPLEDLQLEGDELVLVLDRLQDPGNLGTLVRTADAVGAAAVIMIEPCVDIFYPTAVRATMGSIFNLPLVWVSDVDELAVTLREAHLRTVGADPVKGILWGQGLWYGGAALVLGNEARGLSQDVREHLDNWVRLPIAGGAESLNVAVAGGVLAYLWLRDNPSAY